jgi:hypothetical protein
MRTLGKVLPETFSPTKAEHLMKEYFHGYWELANILLDHSLIPLATEFPEDPAHTREDYWMVGRFLRNEHPRHVRHERDFYEMLNEFDRSARTFNHLKALGDPAAAWEYLKKNRQDIGPAKTLNKYGQALRKLRTQEHLIYHNATKSADKKREELDELAERKHELFRRAVEEIKRREP